MKLIGVTGKAGAGKTTFTNYFEKKSNIGAIHVDEIMNDIKKKRLSFFMKKDKHGEKTEIKSGLKFFIYKNKVLYTMLMKIRAFIVEKEIDRRINEFRAQGKDFVLVDDVYLSYLNNYQDFDKVYYIQRPYFTRLEAIRKRDEVDKKTLVASEIAFKKKNYKVNLVDPRIEVVENNYPTMEEYEKFLEGLYDERYKSYNFDDWIKVPKRKRETRINEVSQKLRKTKGKCDKETEKI